MTLRVADHRCPKNHSCPAVTACPTQAIRQEGFAAPRIDMQKCLQCGRCVFICPTGAIRQSV